jgi:bis(5'-adenosyl)-triphosphatase
MMKESKMTGCPFCNESVKQSAFYSNGEFIAIYNIAPVLPGHSLVIPAAHFTSVMALDNKALNGFFETARIAVKILMKAFNTDSFDWSIQEKPEAGQTIEHLHLHIVPRLKGDLKRPGDWYPLLQDNDEVIIDSIERARLNPAAMEQIVTELKRIAATIS